MPRVEYRVGNGGTFLQTIVFTFSEDVTSVSGNTTTTCGGVNNTTISGLSVMVEFGHVTCDVNADGVVNRTDLKEIKMEVGRGLLTEDNFRNDITVDGKVNHGDTSLEKSKL